MSPTVPCPACGRPTAPHRATCMYCGATMPALTAVPPAPAPRKELPKDLDKAFQRAMLHGDMRQLRQVLDGAESKPVVVERTVGRPRDPEASELEAEVAELAAVPVEELYARLSQAVVQAGSWEDDARAAADVLRQAQSTIEQLIAGLDDVESPPLLVLPPFRQPWALFVAPPGDDSRLRDVAEALDVDLATARQVAVLGYPRAALRSADRADLEARAERYRQALELHARVLGEPELRSQPAARLVLSLAADGPWRSAVSSTWEPDSSVIPSLSARDEAPPTLRLVVVGEVTIARYRELRGRRKDDGRLSSHGDRRLRVLDLHHDDGVLRVVEGVTQLEGWRGLDPRSSALAFHGLSEALAARYPDVTMTGRCICRPTRQPETRDDGRVEAAGWPAWEEHSRACRALYL